MSLDAEQLKNQIPFYLTARTEQKELVTNLEALMRGARTGYYIPAARAPDSDAMLQGDGWQEFKLFSFDTGERRSIRGIVLSNSCDISKDNDRPIAPKVVFAPIVKLDSIEARLRERGLAADAIDGRIAAIKSQSVTNIFYLPAGGPLEQDYVALLDDLHSMPVDAHEDGRKLFTLSMAGFYLLSFKLSVHFCRLHEQVDRRPEDEAA